MISRSLAAVALAAVGTLALASCSAPDSDSTTPGDYAQDGVFTTVITQDPGDLNPLVTNLVAAQVVGAYAYDSLVFFEPTTGKPQPYLAASWKEDANSVSFTLKDGITCSDGEPFTAQTAADNFTWIVDPANGSPLKDSIIPGDAIATASGNTVTVTTPAPYPFLLNAVGSSALACSAALKDPKSASSKSDGTGLFTISEVVPNDHITLERRDGYNWGPNGTTTSDTLGVPKTVIIKIVIDPSTRANLLLSKEINAAVVSGPDEERLASAQLDSLSYPLMSGQILFNHHPGLPTADEAVRVALVQASDLDTYTKINTAEKGTRATSLISAQPKTCDYDSITGSLPAFDAAAAAKTLADAGWVMGSDGTLEKNGTPLAVNLVYNNSVDAMSAGAEYLSGEWQKLGVAVKLMGGDQNFVLSNTFSAPDPSAWGVALGLMLQSNTPTIFPAYFSGPTPPNGTNFAFIDNPRYVQLTAQAATLPSDESCAVYQKAEEALFASADVVPVSTSPNNMYFNGAVSLIPPAAGVLPAAAIRVLK